jgi:alpha-glucoside transport system substrate-binding protein
MTTTRIRPRQRLLWQLVSIALIAGACSSGQSAEPQNTTSQSAPAEQNATTTTAAPASEEFDVTFDPGFVTQAEEKASEIVGDQDLSGTSVQVEGHLGGFEEALLVEAISAFERATGIDVSYTGGRNLETRLETAVRAGDPPDVAHESGAGNMQRWAREGRLVPLDFIEGFEENYHSGAVEAASVDGTPYSSPSAWHSMGVWYDPANHSGDVPPENWEAFLEWARGVVEEGRTPFCMGLDAGDNTPVQAAYFIEEIFVKTYGAELARQWASGQLPWTSPEVRTAFEMWGEIGTVDDMISGGRQGALATPGGEGPVGLYSEPATCEVIHWGSYTGNIILNIYPDLDPSRVDFFPTPAPEGGFPTHEQASGWAVYAFNDRPEVRAFMEYWASAEFQNLLASGGSWVMSHKDVAPEAYPTEHMRKAQQQLHDAEDVAFGPFFIMPTSVRMPYLRAVADYMLQPESLDQQLETVQEAVDQLNQ